MAPFASLGGVAESAVAVHASSVQPSSVGTNLMLEVDLGSPRLRSRQLVAESTDVGSKLLLAGGPLHVNQHRASLPSLYRKVAQPAPEGVYRLAPQWHRSFPPSHAPRPLRFERARSPSIDSHSWRSRTSPSPTGLGQSEQRVASSEPH